jgi:hypothetical protein
MISRDNLYKITASSLDKYLLFKDWIRNYNFPNKKLMVFNLHEDTLVIPSSEKYKDFYIVLPDVIDTLADIYEKSAKEIIKDITSSYYDMLEFRIKSKISEDGVLPLGYASNCIEGLKELILYSACAEQSKEPICLRSTNNAKEILDNFKLAQTEVGSFIINIDIQVVDEKYEQFKLPDCNNDIPVEHKIVKRIGKAIHQIDEIAKDQSSFDKLLPTAYESGVTANICDALMKLKPENVDAEIETKIRYASAISQRLDDIEVVNFKGNHFYVIDEISKRYKNVENKKNANIRGIIKSLDKTRVSKQRYKRNISILTSIEGQERVIKAELSEEDHNSACDAFRDEQEIEVNGILDMGKKNWELKQISSFKIIKR